MFGITKCPKGYEKLDLLGKGGCAVVWLCKDIKTNQKVAVKQFPKCPKNDSNYQSGLSEIKTTKLFYTFSGKPHKCYEGHPGLKSLCKLLDSQEDKHDLWIIYELCGKPLSKMLFQTKGQFYRGERIYEVKQDPKIMSILEKNNCKEFKKIVRSILNVLALFKKENIVHSDLKSENILIELNYKKQKVFYNTNNSI